VDFDWAWNKVKECILDNFAGEPEHGVFSPSVQNTLYLAEKQVLDTIPEVNDTYMIHIVFPSQSVPEIYRFIFNFRRYPPSI
jgi:urate oxidase